MDFRTGPAARCRSSPAGFGLLIGIQRHLVRFPPDAGLFIAAERRMRRVDMIAVGPHATGFNAATHAIGEVGIPRPHPGAETKLGLIGDSQRFRFVLKVVTPITGPKISSGRNAYRCDL